MVKKILVALFCFGVSYLSLAQITFSKQEGPNGGMVSEVVLNSSSHIFIRVSTPNGLSSVYRSTNNGTDWTKLSIGTNGLDDFEAIDILIDGSNKIYILSKTKIYRSSATSNGDLWVSVSPPSPFQSGDELAKTNDGELYMLHSGLGVFRSNDDGDTWTNISNNLPSPSNYTSIIALDNDVYVGVLNSGTYKLSNNSSVWSAFNTGITLPDQASSFAVRGTMLYQTDRDGVHYYNGSTWVQIGGQGLGGTKEIAENFNNSDHGVLIGSGNITYVYFRTIGKLYKSSNATDGPWTDITGVGVGDQILSANTFSSGASVFVGYANRGLRRSIDDAVNWNFSDNGLAFNSNKSFVTANTTDEFFVADGGPYLHSSNSSGFSWNRELLNSCTSCSFSALIKLGSGNLLAIGNETYRSTNNGASWSDIGGPSVYLDKAVTGTGAKFFGHNLNGSIHSYYVSTSATPAATWSSLAVTGLPVNYTLQGFEADAFSNLYFLTDSGPVKFFKVINTQTAANEITNSELSQIESLRSFNGNIYLSGFNNSAGKYQIAKTVDGGSNWTYINSPLGISLDDFYFISTDIILGIDESGVSSKFYYTNDAGITWKEVSNFNEGSKTRIAGASIDINGFVNVVFNGAASYRSNDALYRPNAVTNLKSIGSSDVEIVLEWDHDGQFLSDFEIGRRIQGEPTYAVLDTISYQDRYYVDNTIAKNTNYQYRIIALSVAGASDPISANVASANTCTLTIPDNRSWTGTVPASFSNSTIGIRKLNDNSYLISDFTAGSLVGEGLPAQIETKFFENCGQPFIDPANDVYPDGSGTWTSGTNTLVLRFQPNKQNYTPSSHIITLALNLNDPAPEKPSNVKALISGNSSIDISWDAGYYHKSYSIGRATSMVGPYTEVASTNYPAVGVIDNGPFTEGVEYFYRVRASNGNASPLTTDSDISSVIFKKPNFVVANTALSNFIGASIGSYWADFDSDGEVDYLTLSFDAVAQSTTPIIFRNLGNGDFAKMDVALSGTNNHLFASVIDYNNDGNEDIIFGIDETNGVDFYTGNGDFTFSAVSGSQLGDIASVDIVADNVSWSDINNDGLLDVLLISGEDTKSPKLYKQNVDHSFTLLAAGDLSTDLERRSMALWADYDKDGFSDVLITNSNGPLRLFQNLGNETFTKVTVGNFSSTNALSAAWGDYNNDSKIDLFISETAGNAIFLNSGSGSFTKNTSTLITQPVLSVTSTWGDYNNDGFLDLFVGGFIGQPNRLFLRDPSSTSSIVFTKIEGEKINDSSITNYGAGHSDYNKDGFLDIGKSAFAFNDIDDSVVPVNNSLFKNNNSVGNWVELNLIPVNGNKSAIGAKITLVADGKTQFREIQSSAGVASRNSLIVHFGLGTATSITSLEVKFPAGPLGPSITKVLTNQNVNQIIDLAEDTEGPQISTFTPENKNKGFGQYDISLTAVDAVSTVAMDFYFRKIGGTAFAKQGFSSSSPNSFITTVSESFYDDMGMEFYFEATDPFGNTSRSPATGSYYSYLNYAGTNAPKFPTTSLVFGGTDKTWNIVSIPFDLGSSATVTSVLDELGAFDDTQWRLLTYQNQTTWAEFPGNFSSFSRGKGYFLNVKTPPSAGITIGDPLLAPQNNQANLFSLSLSQGWNQIGNPYLVPISWADVKAFNATVTDVGDLKIYNSNARSYGDSDVLGVYQGGFVFANAAVSDYKISFDGQTTGGRKKSNGRIASTELDNDNWRAMFTLKQADVEFILGGVGMSPDAKISYDGFDDVTLPRLNEFLEMNFHHPEHFAKRFSRDVVPTQSEYTWEFTVDSNLRGTTTINWNNDGFGLNDKELYLFDVAKQKIMDMRQTSSYSFDAEHSNTFKVYYGSDLKGRIRPEKVLLGQAYPNPASSITTIPFTLPASANLFQVKLEVYDMMGRRVSVLQDGMLPSGFYEAQWNTDSQQLTNGLYTYRLAVAGSGKNEVFSNKLILKK